MGDCALHGFGLRASGCRIAYIESTIAIRTEHGDTYSRAASTNAGGNSNALLEHTHVVLP